MKISTKGRYGLAAMVHIARYYAPGQAIPIISISEKLGISKIYLEQVFSLLKRARLVTSTKGAQGGYQLGFSPNEITIFEVLSATEPSLFEDTEATISDSSPEIEAAMQSVVFDMLNQKLQETLSKITLADLVKEAEKNTPDDGFMLFI